MNLEKKKRELRNYLVGNGWQEIITYSLVSPEMSQELGSPEKHFYQLSTPKSKNHQYYRQALLPSHLQAIKHNFSHQNKDLFFFEISSIYGPTYQEELLILSG